MGALFLGGFVLLVFSSIGLCVEKKHVLSLLVLLEGFFLGIFCCMSAICLVGDPSCLLIMLVIGVCEAGVCLATVVRMVRMSGNDHVLSLAVFKC